MRVFIITALLVACAGKTETIDAGVDAKPDVNMCVYQETRTNSDRTCTKNDECVIVTRQKDCCQEIAEGIRADQEVRFKNEQTQMTSSCPGCGCQAQSVDDLGMKGQVFKASCDMGLCTSHAAM